MTFSIFEGQEPGQIIFQVKLRLIFATSAFPAYSGPLFPALRNTGSYMEAGSSYQQ